MQLWQRFRRKSLLVRTRPYSRGNKSKSGGGGGGVGWTGRGGPISSYQILSCLDVNLDDRVDRGIFFCKAPERIDTYEIVPNRGSQSRWSYSNPGSLIWSVDSIVTDCVIWNWPIVTKHTKSYLIAWTRNVSYLNLKYQKSVTIGCDWSIVALVTDRAWCERRIKGS